MALFSVAQSTSSKLQVQFFLCCRSSNCDKELIILKQEFDTKQLNNLYTGRILQAETPASTASHRAFVSVGAYLGDFSRPQPVSKFLNADRNNVHFWLRVNEIMIQDIEQLGNVDYERTVFSLVDIHSLEELKDELGKYLDDFSLLSTDYRAR